MSNFEVLTIVIACISAFISILAIAGQRKLQREANDLQRATAALARKQLEILENEEKSKNRANIKLDLVRSGSGYRFRLENIGNQNARNVNLKLVLSNEKDDPIIKSEYKEKLPAPHLAPGSSISLIAALSLSSPTAYNAIVSWVNPDGTEACYETYTAL